MGKGAAYSTSSIHKINTRSSTESEVVSVNDVMPQIIWTRYFLEAQGFPIEDNILYQDNKSAMLLENNGRASSSRRTRHMHIRYFFISDRVRAKEISIEYCPTEDMLADFFTKPLQGKQFFKLRDLIMNIESSSPYHSSHRSVLRTTCVGNRDSEVATIAIDSTRTMEANSTHTGTSKGNTNNDNDEGWILVKR